MVNSKLKPEIEFNESKKTNAEDVGFSTDLYEVELLETRVVVALGKIKYTYTGKNIFYFLVYLIDAEDKVKAQIGVMEFGKSDVSKYAHGDLEQFAKDGHELLLHSFVDKDFLSENSLQNVVNKDKIEPEDKNAKKEKEDKKDDESDEEYDVDDLHNIKIPTKNKDKDVPLVKDAIFEDMTNADIPDLLPEETKAEADKLKNKSANLNWVQRFMKNDNYRIHNMAKDRDSFFATVLYAFKQLGKKTTIDTLRNIVADGVNSDALQMYSSLYNAFNNEIADNQHKISVVKSNIQKTKERYKDTNDIATNKMLLDQINALKDDAKTFQKYIAKYQPLFERFQFMKEVHNAAQLRSKIMESTYTADDFAVAKIEEKLNIKMILLSKTRFDEGDEDAVIMCSFSGGDVTKPEYYIIATFENNHFDLVSYKDKKILKFTELPYYMKTLVVNKCIERNARVFHRVTDFRDFQTKFGIDPVANSYEDSVVVSDLYDDTTHFMFYIASADEEPGEGSGEKISEKNKLLFKDLSKNWRRQLDDEFVAPFMLDNKQWQTVEHFYQASKFKKGFPDFYASFSLDSDSEIANDVKKAKAAGGKSGRFEKELLRPSQIKIDADFYGGRDVVERKNAIKAKFQQNEDLKRTLIKTKDAKLLHFVRGQEPEIDKILMEVRKGISQK
jgi:predicted NAD-dependent protein-ADP-ribosyltransferase YbiA (DUF1768 family)